MQPSGPGAKAIPEGESGPSTADVERVRQLAEADNHATFATARRDGSIQVSLVRVGVIEHPVNGQPTVAVLLRPNTVKLRNLRRRPRAAVQFRLGTQWLTVEGRATLIGRDDPLEGFDAEGFRQLRRAHYLATGGEPETWEAWDRKLEGERGSLAYVAMERVYGSPPRGA
jgi:PPOX class probable F420-dependent enzyme